MHGSNIHVHLSYPLLTRHDGMGPWPSRYANLAALKKPKLRLERLLGLLDLISAHALWSLLSVVWIVEPLVRVFLLDNLDHILVL